MKVLLTGAGGFLGKHVARKMRAKKWQVIETTRNEKLVESRIFLDLEKPESIINVGRRCDFDVIVHLGALVEFDDLKSNSLFCINSLATGILSCVAKEKKAQMIYASTINVYGNSSKIIDRFSKTNPSTAYSKSKLLGEKLMVAPRSKSCVLRFAGIFGLNGPKHLGINKTINSVISGVAPITYGKGGGKRNYIYVKDAAEVIIAVIDQRISGVHICSGDEVLSLNKMIWNVCKKFSKNLKPIIQEGDLIDDYIAIHSDRLPKPRSFDEALMDMKNEISLFR